LFGIYRAPVGQKFIKQINTVPVPHRSAFALSYQQNTPYAEIFLNLPFFWLIYNVNRVHAKSKKKGFLRSLKGNKKVKRGVKSLEHFTTVALNGMDLDKWIFQQTT